MSVPRADSRADSGDPLETIQARRCLDEINAFILHGAGEIVSAPGKISLVWHDPAYDAQRYLAIKPAGDDQVMVNGRRYPASEAGLKRGLKLCLAEMQLIP